MIATRTGAQNPFGIRDMIGNIAEFIDDCYTRDLAHVPDDEKAITQDGCWEMNYKGGVYGSPDFELSPFARNAAPTQLALSLVGFRIARDLKD